MLKKELEKVLREEQFPEHSYSLEGGLFFDRWCLDQQDGNWLVYKREKAINKVGDTFEEDGVLTNSQSFIDEGMACQYLYSCLKSEAGVSK